MEALLLCSGCSHTELRVAVGGGIYVKLGGTWIRD